MPYQNIINNFTKQLEHSNSQFKTLLPISMDVIQIVESEVGPGPKGSILSYQQKKCEKESESSIINNDAYPNYTDYDFPVVVQNFGTVPTMGEKNVYDRLYVSKSASMDIENKTLYM